MLSKFVTNQVGQQRVGQHEATDDLRIYEFLRMKLPCITNSSSTLDPENFIEELHKVLDVIHITNNERVE